MSNPEGVLVVFGSKLSWGDKRANEKAIRDIEKRAGGREWRSPVDRQERDLYRGGRGKRK